MASNWHDELRKRDTGFKVQYTVVDHPELYSYVCKNSGRESELQLELRQMIESQELAMASGTPDEAQFIQLLIELTGSKNIIEIGVFKGYTTLAMAMKLPKDGKIIGLDISEYWSPLPEQYWKRAGVDHLIEMRFGPALKSLQALIDEKKEGTFDLIFIDANKNDYPEYYELSLKLVRSGGLILVDNVLFHGKVTKEETSMDENTKAIHTLNQRIHKDDRITMSMIPIADGLTICRKK